MHRFWNSIIEPIFSILKPRIVVEIGSDQGDNTRKLLQYCQKHNGNLHSIDPLPRFDVTKWKEEYGDTVVFHVALSLNALPKIDRMDAVLIDGDHNWYTVFHELKLVEKSSKRNNHAFPLVLLHDIGWPYGRRDLYYNPDNIPEAYRKPYKKLGIKPGNAELAEQGGLNPHLYNAIYENDLQNGVLTAVEDFISQSDQHFEFVNIPGLWGLGILFAKRNNNQELNIFLEDFAPKSLSALIGSIEKGRINDKIEFETLKQTTQKIQEDYSHKLKGLESKVELIQGNLDEKAEALKNVESTLQLEAEEHQRTRKEKESLQSKVELIQGNLDEKAEALKNVESALQLEAGEHQRTMKGSEELLGKLTIKLDNREQALEKFRHATDTRISNLSLKLKERPIFEEQLREMLRLCQQHWKKTNRGLSQVRSDLEALLTSRRWQVGNSIIRTLERCLSRPKGPLATDHMFQLLFSLKNRQQAFGEVISQVLPGLINRQKAFSEIIEGVLRQNVIADSRCINQDDSGYTPATAIPIKRTLSKISIISAVYNKSGSLPEYIESMALQSYEGAIELMLVDDVSTDESREIIRCLGKAMDVPGKFTVRLLKNQTNMGNCGSRNRGLTESTGDVIVVIDADCIVNNLFIEERVAAHKQGYDVCIGPMGIESKGRKIAELHELLLKDENSLHREMRLQYPRVPTAFLNCVTRNFSITRQFLNSVGGYLFDESFSYKKGPDSGFGWEDVEMGYRLFINRARIWFVKKAISIHKSHKPEFSDSEKSLMSVKNFRKLFNKYPEIVQVAPDWARDTFTKIESWLNKYNYTENEDAFHIAEQINKVAASIPVRRTSKARLKIATYRWHVGHQYDLWKLPYDFTLFYGLSGITANWDYRNRPLPENTSFKLIGPKGGKPNFHEYDMVILHFDEFVLRPELSLGRVSSCWGEQFKYMMENFPGPKVAICHGVPVFKGACDEHYDKSDLGEIIESYRKELVEYLGDTLVICNSYQSQKEWGFKNSKVIWHGFDPLMYLPSKHSEKIITVVGDITVRPHYRGLRFYKKVMENIGWKADILAKGMHNSVEKPALDEKFYKTENELGLASFLNYTHFLSNYGIFFNPTLRSPMPRTRGEALMAGLAIVATPTHDADLFIDHCYNGFLSHDADECSLILMELKENEDLRRKIGKRGHELAMDLFHVNRFIKDWETIIEEILSENKRGFNAVIVGADNLSARPKVQRATLKRVAFVCGASKDAGTTRYRVDASIEALEHEGVMTDRIFSDQLEHMTESFYADKYSLIVCHRVAMSDSYAKLVTQAKKYGNLIVADIDDLLFDDDYASFFDEIKRRPYKAVASEVERFRKALSKVQYSTVTTPSLRERLRKLGLSNIEIVPNTVMDDTLLMSNVAYKERLIRKPGEEILIGYPSGSKTHELDFKVAVPALLRVLQKYPGVRLMLMGEIEIPEALLPFKNRVEMIKLVKPTWLPRNLALMDINISPLEDRPFCNCKSAIKYIEAGLVGVPTVATPTTPFMEAIEHDKNGLLANSENDWFSCLSRLVNDKSLRERLGEAAREHSLANYTSRNREERLVELYTNWLKGF